MEQSLTSFENTFDDSLTDYFHQHPWQASCLVTTTLCKLTTSRLRFVHHIENFNESPKPSRLSHMQRTHPPLPFVPKLHSISGKAMTPFHPKDMGSIRKLPSRSIPAPSPGPQSKARKNKQICQELLFIDDATQTYHVLAHPREWKAVDPGKMDGKKLQRCRLESQWDGWQCRTRLGRSRNTTFESEHLAIDVQGSIYGENRGGLR